MAIEVLLAAVSILVLLALGVGILIGFKVKGSTRRNLPDLRTQQQEGIDLERGVSQDWVNDRKSQLTSGCSQTIILVLVGVIAALVLAGYWFIQFMKALSHGHPG
jgi:hypothetical protein